MRLFCLQVILQKCVGRRGICEISKTLSLISLFASFLPLLRLLRQNEEEEEEEEEEREKESLWRRRVQKKETELSTPKICSSKAKPWTLSLTMLKIDSSTPTAFNRFFFLVTLFVFFPIHFRSLLSLFPFLLGFCCSCCSIYSLSSSSRNMEKLPVAMHSLFLEREREEINMFISTRG